MYDPQYLNHTIHSLTRFELKYFESAMTSDPQWQAAIHEYFDKPNNNLRQSVLHFEQFSGRILDTLKRFYQRPAEHHLLELINHGEELIRTKCYRACDILIQRGNIVGKALARLDILIELNRLRMQLTLLGHEEKPLPAQLTA